MIKSGFIWKVRVVMFLHVDDFLRRGYDLIRHVVAASILQDNQSPVNLAEQQIEREIAIRHRNNRVDRVMVSATDKVTKLLMNGVYGLAIFVLGRQFLDLA